MIFGIGTDMVSIDRIKAVHDRFGERFARRIMGSAELATYRTHNDKSRLLAKRFAVKEAAVKALGTGERQGVLLKDFSITHSPLGKPMLSISGEAAKRCESLGIVAHHVSLSDEQNSVVAFVILETSDTHHAATT